MRGSRLSAPARDAGRLLGLQIAQGRRRRRYTVAELAERVGVSVVTIRKVERGDPSVAIGTVFEAATIVGVPLFNVDRSELGSLIAREADRLALLPSRVDEPVPVNDDF